MTDLKDALRACVDVMMHNGVPVDKEHPARIALDKAKAVLATGTADAAEAHGEPDLTNPVNALTRARDGWQDEARSLAERLRLTELDNDLLREHQARDVWIYQGDGEDHIESMGSHMVVVIHARDLRTLIDVRRTDAGGDDTPRPTAAAPTNSGLADEHIQEIWNGMPGGRDGFLKQWGYIQFARAIELAAHASILEGATNLLSRYIELNMSNYGTEDVDALNAWAVEEYSLLKGQECSNVG